MKEWLLTNWLFVLGFFGQFLFAMRFLIQWICSELKKESHIPVTFWYFSLSGGVILLIYALMRQDPVFIVGQATGIIVYSRNLRLIHLKRKTGGTVKDAIE